MHLACALAVLLLVLEDSLSDAEAIAGRQENVARSNWCNEHRTLHRRMDSVEERVEKTVEHLYSEVKTLLDTMVDPAWHPPLGTGNPTMDIFEEDSR
ncbi:placenta-specific protein 9 [Ambystoma mexicanum]|uniref:placenta-specific protein 9 n=1 Tax=Ambystoma mexicanum TaxID=8296 RepID=UPI0037E776BC